MSLPVLCAWVLGLTACAGPSSDSAGEGPSEGVLRVLTYNVHGLPSLITGDDTVGRIGSIGPLLEEFPLIGLQEDFTPEGHEVLMEAVSHDVRPWFDATLEGRFYGSGLTLLSRAEQVGYHEQHYSDCHGVVDGASDCLASKGVQRVRLRLGPDAEIDVYNTHIEAGNGKSDEAVRGVQVSEVIQLIEAQSAGMALVLMGDFNLSGSDEVDAALTEKLLRDAGLQTLCDAVACGDPGRIDKILFRSGERVQLEARAWSVEERFVDEAGTALSDHEAIGGELHWSRVDGP